jgi:V8-like Glu-specific endopeptidase/DNA-binding ferritin-like protein (Dps family)
MIKLNIKIWALCLLFVANTALKADEGMWPLTMIAKLQDKMQARGLNLTAEDIYSINKASVKDGIVRLQTTAGRMFCTGEVISKEGLFTTNHHCGYGAIQSLSTIEDNIMRNGFWAQSKDKERPANFHIGFLRKIEEVTGEMTRGVTLTMGDEARNKGIADNKANLLKSMKENLGDQVGNYQIDIVAFYNDNRYMAMYYEVYKDIRLVGTPPENIGKFGGETDNWRWPRHTGDFSMFRIYANTDNQPATFSLENKPYAPKHAFKVSLKGYKEGDYAMILGYPGTTQRYTYSEGIRYLGQKQRPMRVNVRRSIMDVYESYMKKDETVRLMYSDKLAGLGNYWNKFNGEAKDLSKPGLYEKSKARELAFEKWVRDNNKQDEYGNVTSLYDEAYLELNKIGLYSVYMFDGLYKSQAVVNVLRTAGLVGYMGKKDEASKASAKAYYDNLKGGIDGSFSEYYEPIEKQVLEQILKHIYMDLDNTYFSAYMKKLGKKYKSDYAAMANYMWEKSNYTTKEKYSKIMDKNKAKCYSKDPLYMFVTDYQNIINETLKDRLDAANSKLARADRLFTAGILEQNPTALMAPDANATMRLTYGRVLSYESRDAVENNVFTTSQGIIDKYKPNDFEFDAPEKMIGMLKNKDFGQYADADGSLHICFLSDNDITGGNSGSPVLNADGHLIGLAFDGNWEAISSDFAFIPALQRTISVDIRYVLWTIDKWGGASNIIKELELVK